MAPQRDYYADLGLTPTADVAEIKKQFRKLALKYHPDRNPGREQEVNSQFQIIQAAHEVLSDADAKAKYDAAFMRSASRYPGASGVRGNPWQNVSQQFPVPPRRTTRTATSGAQRWNERFSAGVPPTARQHASAATAARAFESMRKGGAKSGQQERRAPPPPPPPRTDSAKKRAEASFGAKKTGYYPRSNTPGDEPPVTNNNYSSRVNTERPEPAPEPAPKPTPVPDPVPDIFAQFREKSRSEESFEDPRQSSPYTKSGGEKTDPFDSVPLNRANTTKESSEPTSKQRGPREGEMRWEQMEDLGSCLLPQVRDLLLHSKLEQRRRLLLHQMVICSRQTRQAALLLLTMQLNPLLIITKIVEVGTKNKPRVPSGTHGALQSLSPFEQKQYHILRNLITNQHVPVSKPKNKPHHNTPCSHISPDAEKMNANNISPTSFNFNLDDDAFSPNSPGASRFRKSNSADGINTTFVKDESSATWQFSAGNGEYDPRPQARSQSSSKAGRRSPIKRRPVPSANVPDSGAQAPQNATGFDAESWSTQFGPQTFVPRPITPNPSGSPTRLGRPNTRKTRTPKPMAGNAAIVDDSSEDDIYSWAGRKTDAKAATVDSPQAMDIDPPPAGVHIPTPPPLVPTTPAAASTTASATVPSTIPPAPQSRSQSQPPSHPHPVVARNIPVEPSRPEWRPGNVTGLGQMYEQPEERKEIPVTFKGSEDSEEFRATLEDLKNVAPFAPPKAGLKSFTELKDNLPFESQASSELHLNVPHAHPLVFPEPPIAPKLPPTVAVDSIKPNVPSWNKYLEEFESYLRRWDIFNSQVVDHFATRKSNISHARASKGYSFLGARGDADVVEYHNWLEQDNGVRQRWLAACEEHEMRFREFMTFREKMK
ncbi:uncharacterized protein TRIVIDRAFT_29668 [Trichoderma virens Gv29-8]|uniref:J domain-containing protein n=1 Tax=Hypocrea virens (strain Gv29-8 / FGSC 10586) TaxID=413071 RepID=G9MTJ5_HYPVG|nr:uncharacterized protein TRIVIDRAFT_29668 [Trichoderma virens Gv29-8]EHK22346.1 hypothetical protein TRIVIDRAFT_29668 [Trichoderma virens Gv29-8]